MSDFSLDAYSDGGEADADADVAEPTFPIHTSATRAKRTSPSARRDDDEVSRHVLRVIRTAAAAGSEPVVPGYSPRMSIDMACAHSWAPYTAVIPALRSLSFLSLGDERSRRVAKEAIAELFGHATPFDAGRRFPAGEVYVCLDRAPLASYVQRIQRYVTVADLLCGSKTEACDGFLRGVENAIDVLTSNNGYSVVLYDREVFESVFLLTWTEAA
uniref:Uncharacterized protein n=1 Tax=Leersia perrieri TaxID=77586 RepID=A0A0D9WA46_9ORYZ